MIVFLFTVVGGQREPLGLCPTAGGDGRPLVRAMVTGRGGEGGGGRERGGGEGGGGREGGGGKGREGGGGGGEGGFTMSNMTSCFLSRRPHFRESRLDIEM